mgnify:CR=1 FL=1
MSVPAPECNWPERDSARFLTPFCFRPSPRLAFVHRALTSLLALLALLGLAPRLGEQPLWGLALIGFWGLLGYQEWRLRRARARSPDRFGLNDGRWWLGFGDSVEWARLEGEVLLWSRLVVLPFKLDSGVSCTLVCCRDSLLADDLRRLRVWLHSELNYA